jgi:hypothetical protein
MYSGPKIIENGLVFGFDASETSFRFNKGKPTTNILTTISKAGVQNDTYFKTNSGTEEINVPKVGLRTVHYVNIYNDYNGGSGNCCPAPISFGDISISPSTLYTYQIVYRTTDGYANANYMYHYEYNSGTYVTEYGLHSFGREEDLGEGWKHGWGTFTSNASANRFITYLFHYQYAIWNKIQVAAIGITQGNSVLRPHQIPNVNTTRSATNSLINLTKSSSIDVSNVSFNSSGSLTFDGTNDYISTSNSSLIHGTSDWTYSALVKFAGTPSLGTVFENGTWGNCLLIRFENNGFTLYSMSSYWGFFSFTPTLGVWYNLDFVRNGNVVNFYVNGTYSSQLSFTANVQPSSNLYIGMSQHSAGQCFNGDIQVAKIYNRALSATEVVSNFKAYQKRFNI